jgi:hypothetical protein
LFVLEGEKEEQRMYNIPLMGLFCSTPIKLPRKAQLYKLKQLKLNVHHIRSNVHMSSPTRQVSLSINGRGGGFWRQFTIIKEETEKTILKGHTDNALPHHPKHKHLRRLSVAMVG